LGGLFAAIARTYSPLITGLDAMETTTTRALCCSMNFLDSISFKKCNDLDIGRKLNWGFGMSVLFEGVTGAAWNNQRRIMTKSVFFATAITVLASSTSHATLVGGCQGWFATAPAVCGAVSEVGYNPTAQPFTVTAAPALNQINSTSVSVGGVGAGTGVGTFGTATGNYGAAHISVSSFSSYPAGYNSQSGASSRADIGFVDGFTVGATDLLVSFVSSISGFYTGAGTGATAFNLDDLTANSFAIYDSELFTYKNSPSSSYTMNVLLPAGHTFLFNWTMEAEADSGSGDYSALPSERRS
jgi:hypothetical protein